MTTRPPADEWTPSSWQLRPAVQQPSYADKAALGRVLADLAQLPPIVVSWEIESLKRQVADAQQGRRFVLQGGDCAETFSECESGVIARKLKILLQMSLIMLHGLKRPVIRVGRFAGQYAKPRSADTETRDGVTLPSYRGDLVNRPGFSPADREPDPELLLRGYERAALTLNFVRALIDGGFADLHHPEYWDLGFMHHSPWRDQYQRLVDSIADSLDFFEAMSGSQVHEASRAPFYASHEALHLSYEAAQTRYIERQQRWYNLSTHMPWIGMRTADLAGAHVEYCRGIANPVGVKVGPDMTGDWLRGLCYVLNPRAEPGRLVLIHRLGAGRIAAQLPRLIDAVRSDCGPILWVCDPMHGNTETIAGGVKTRRFDNIVEELEAAFRIHREHGSRLGGVHFELTGEDVTECIGGARGLEERDLSRAYRSQVDPRLNYEQALELAMRIAGHARAV
jgi:3-deoxy-7-phosphoheptulonate synthase